MSTRYINLQNTPNPAGVAVESVSFRSDSVAAAPVTLHGLLFRPAGTTTAVPGVVVTGAWTSVKEQMAGNYARELAACGLAALAFDFRGWGKSEGEPRYVEDPTTKTRDILAAATYLAQREDLDHARVFGLGICASSGYMAAAAAGDGPLRRVALIAPWLHDPAIAQAVYGGPDGVAALLAASDAADAHSAPLTAASATDERSVIYRAPYYTEPARGLIPAYDNRFSLLSWRPWLTYDGLASAERLTRPLLLVGSPGMALPAGAAPYEARCKAPLRKVWLGEDVSQFDFYDRADVVQEAADAVAEFLSH